MKSGKTVRFFPYRKRLLGGSGLLLILMMVLALSAGGCATTTGTSLSEPGPPGAGGDQDQVEETAGRSAGSQAVEDELRGRVRALNARLKAEIQARQSLERRLEVAHASREDAIREVVRMRARIQGMASEAEASAMYAEARVILDRMEEEAFNLEALEQLDLARSYMARGKSALDADNPGGAAYLFDLIPGNKATL